MRYHSKCDMSSCQWTFGNVGIAGILLSSGFSSDLEIGILSRADLISELVDALMSGCAR